MKVYVYNHSCYVFINPRYVIAMYFLKDCVSVRTPEGLFNISLENGDTLAMVVERCNQ